MKNLDLQKQIEDIQLLINRYENYVHNKIFPKLIMRIKLDNLYAKLWTLKDLQKNGTLYLYPYDKLITQE